MCMIRDLVLCRQGSPLENRKLGQLVAVFSSTAYIYVNKVILKKLQPLLLTKIIFKIDLQIL